MSEGDAEDRGKWLIPRSPALWPSRPQTLTVSPIQAISPAPIPIPSPLWQEVFSGKSLLPRASLVAQSVKNLPAMWETWQKTWVRSLGQEDPLEEGMATHSSILARRIPMDRGAWRATVHGVTISLT